MPKIHIKREEKYILDLFQFNGAVTTLFQLKVLLFIMEPFFLFLLYVTHIRLIHEECRQDIRRAEATGTK